MSGVLDCLYRVARLLILIASGILVGTGCLDRNPSATTDAVRYRTSLIARPENYLSGVVTELTRQWPANRTVHIVCHGHSVPAGYFRTPVVDTFNAYPHLLHRELKDRFPFAVVNVTVTAIGGENSESGASRFERDVLSLRPDVVTIDYGLNDRGLGLSRARVAWQAMIDLAQAAGVKVILLTPTPDAGAQLDNPADPLSQHAQQIRCLARGNTVALVDSLACFENAVRNGQPLDGLMSQSNHPNRKGHDLVAAELLRWFPLPSGTSARP
jgi:acyl-CoA thioesterase-1